MPELQPDETREQRIMMEIIVDAYGVEEQSMGWYCYLEDRLSFPFLAKCVARRAISPLHIGDEVKVLRMAHESECESEMFVTIRWEKEGLAVPLSQLEAIAADAETGEAVEDWRYWVHRGYEF